MPYDYTFATPSDTNPRFGAIRGEPLFESYFKHFSTVSVNSTALREQFYRLRYQVYCIENAFEDRENHPEGLETDRFDRHSESSVLVHRTTGAVAGGVRIVLPSHDHGWRDLPMWSVCSPENYAARVGHQTVQRTAEVSRIAVSKQFRQIYAQSWAQEGTDSLRIATQLSLGLLAAVVRMCAERGITHICAVMEPSLLRMLARAGVYLQKLGSPVEYHGIRQPAYADLNELLSRTWKERPDVWSLLTKRGEYWPLSQAPRRALAV
jgi:N-acyl amino acid synthase of PEP-CTERM/exosortase system